MILAIDFDKTIHNPLVRQTGKKWGEPYPDATPALEALYEQGHTIIIHTCKAVTPTGIEAVEDWLDYFGIDYHKVTAIKPVADYYIDDRAVKHTSWPETLAAIGYIDEDV